MGLPALYVFFLTVGVASCGSSETIVTDQYEPVNPYERLFEIFGSFFCFDESCENYGSVTEQSYETTLSEDGYSSQIPDVGVVNSSSSYLELCEGLEKLAEEMEAQDPDDFSLKTWVFLKVLFSTMFFEAVDDEKCHPATKMLDTIILAAEKVKLEYVNDENVCTFVEVPIDDVTYSPEPKTTRSGYDAFSTPTTKKTSPTGPTPKPESPSVEPTTEKSAIPCSQPSTTRNPLDTRCEGQSTKPETTTPVGKPSTEKPGVPCPDNGTEKPTSTTPGDCTTGQDEGYAFAPYLGSVRGIPGVHYPNYTDIPITSFSCSDKKYMPGFYADLETGCQVFHVCYEHRRESFLCPVGTLFNQPILACDFWYSSNCSLAPIYYDVNARTANISKEEVDTTVVELIQTITEHQKHVSLTSKVEEHKSVEEALDDLVQFLPVKVKVTVDTPIKADQPIVSGKPTDKAFPPMKPGFGETDELTVPQKFTEKVTQPPKKTEVGGIEDIATKIFDKIIKSATDAISKTRYSIEKIPEPSVPEASGKKEAMKPKLKVPIFKPKVYPMFKVKSKLATKAKLAIPSVAAPFVSKAKLAAPIAAKGKLAAAVPGKVLASKAKIPVATKGKVLAAVPLAKSKAAVPLAAKKLVAAKASVPIVKGKILGSALPLAKSATIKSKIPVTKVKMAPVLKSKLMKTASAPLVKGKLLALPLAKSKVVGSLPLKAKKAKLAKSLVISPLTKKALAVGYMKLLKGKKLAKMG